MNRKKNQKEDKDMAKRRINVGRLWDGMIVPERKEIAKDAVGGRACAKAWDDFQVTEQVQIGKLFGATTINKKKEIKTMAKKRTSGKGTKATKTTKKTAKKTTKKTTSKTKAKKVEKTKEYGKRRSALNDDLVAVFIKDNIKGNNELRLLAYAALQIAGGKAKMTENKINNDRIKIRATETRSNNGLARMSLGLMIRKYIRLVDPKSAEGWLKKLWKEINR